MKTIQQRLMSAFRGPACRSLPSSGTQTEKKYASPLANMATSFPHRCFRSAVGSQQLLRLRQGQYQNLDNPTRSFARSSGNGSNPPDVEKAITFIVSVGYERPIAQGVADALKESGLSGDALLATARQLAGRWEVGEDGGEFCG